MHLLNICLFVVILHSIPKDANLQQLDLCLPKLLPICLNRICEESANCADEFTPVLNKCFKIINKELNWDESKDECVSLGGSLAIVNDCNLLKPLSKFLKSSTPNSKIIWIGGSDKEEEGNWIWIDGTNVPLGVPFWYPKQVYHVIQPSGGVSENCAQIDPSLSYYFSDTDCSRLGTPLCQTEPLLVKTTQNCVCKDAALCGRCPDPFEAVGGSCFYFPYDAKNLSFSTTFDEARNVCKSVHPDAYLPILDSCNLFRELVDFINKNEKYQTDYGYYINANRNEEGDTRLFYWANNKTLEPGIPFWGRNFGKEEPTDDTNHKCATILGRYYYYYFHDFVCDYNEYPFPLCQVDPLL